MQQTLYVVQGYRAGRRAEPELFETAERARSRAAYLGQTCDGVVMWRQTADVDLGDYEDPAEVEVAGQVAELEA